MQQILILPLKHTANPYFWLPRERDTDVYTTIKANILLLLPIRTFQKERKHV